MNNREIIKRAEKIADMFRGQFITDPDVCRALETMAHTVLASLLPTGGKDVDSYCDTPLLDVMG